jgi:hypothetical protein
MRFIIGLVFLVLVLAACKPAKHSYQPAAEANAATPKMIFLSFRIHRDSAGSTITLLHKKAVDGAIKGKPQTTDSPEHFVISIVGKNRLVLNSEKIPHPLFRGVETTNSTGEFERKTVTLTEAEFFVKMRLPEGSQWVLLEEFIGNKRINSAEYQLDK